MPVTNVIVNGGFDQGSTGWSGTDIETKHTENAYLGNGSSNRVAEMDGYSGYTTVMEQSFSVDHALSTNITFKAALRTNSQPADSSGFRVELLDQYGNVLMTQDVLPPAGPLQSYSLPVNFPAAGNYTLRFTELGVDDSLGSIVDDISILVCFTAGTLIETEAGLRPVETLGCGDLVWTADRGLRPLRWVGHRRVTQAEQQADASLRPVVIQPGALGGGLPLRRLAVSPQHRMLLGDWRSELYFGESEILVPAIGLVNGSNIRQEISADLTYVHILFDQHEIVRAEGALSESFYPSALSLTGVEAAARAEILRLFPDLPICAPKTVRPVLRRLETRLVA